MGAVSALADEAKPDQNKGFNGYVNLGAAAVPDYEGSNDYMPAPMIAGKLGYDGYYVEARGPKLRANVMPSGLLPFGLEFGPTAAYRFGRGDVQDNRVDRLRDIDGTLAVGAFAKLSTHTGILAGDEVAFAVESLTGTDKDNDGTTIDFGPSYSFSPWDSVRLSFNLSATWASDNYNATYFGIGSRNALRSGLDTYDAQGGIKDIGATVTASYFWSENWGVTGTVGVTRLVGDAADSPVVDDAGSATQGLVTAGLVYKF